MIVLGHITVSVISGLQAKTVRLTLMNVTTATVAMRTRIKVVALTSMNPAPLVPVVKDLNVFVGMASQVFEKNLAIKSVFFLKTCQQFTGNITNNHGQKSWEKCVLLALLALLRTCQTRIQLRQPNLAPQPPYNVEN